MLQISKLRKFPTFIEVLTPADNPMLVIMSWYVKHLKLKKIEFSFFLHKLYLKRWCVTKTLIKQKNKKHNQTMEQQLI